MRDPAKPENPNGSSPGGMPPKPPVLPPAINEQVFAPKRQMQQIKEVAGKRLRKYHGKFEKAVRKFFKKAGEKERYLQFYDIGFRYEAVFTEVTMDGMDYLGTPVPIRQGEELLAFVTSKIKLPTGFDAIVIRVEKTGNEEFAVLQLIAEAEEKEIKRLQALVENAPRANNPGT